ncbi:MAG: 3-dehydroquinate synthase [Zetaproteobacteria bacterium]|nr:MAG: 3-dehydroquinate synthase [Zetaproteobacteria bacterium]
MKKVYRVDLGDRAYDIHIEPGCLNQIGQALREAVPEAGRCLVVTNETIAPLYLDQVTASLEQTGWICFHCILPDGECFKTLDTWSKILDAMMDARLARNEPALALGGGVIGDMAGFAAACYRRGIPYVQIPTTLLAQVDSSVGGKTAVNHPHGKNMIGAFYQPRLVWIDPRVLKTLEPREVRAGLAEVIKYGAIWDRRFFDWLQDVMPRALALDEEVASQMILSSCRYKAEIVMADETERGQRALLNLGHTFGHAIEALTGYRRYLHGEAVGLGMRMAARLSEQKGFAPAGCEDAILRLLRAAGLPTEIPFFSFRDWMDAMGHDKKNIGTLVRFVLMHDIGHAFICEDVQANEIERLIASFHA